MVELELEKWLRPDDIKGDMELVFVDEGEKGEIPKDEGQKPVETFEISVEFNKGERKLWTMNKTSQRAVAGAYGTDTKQWIGQTVTVFLADQNVHGEMKKVIYARVPEVKAEKKKS